MGIHDFDGVTFASVQDGIRLTGQIKRIFELMRDGNWRTLRQIARATYCLETSASTRLRDFRKPRFGGHTVERRRRERQSGDFIAAAGKIRRVKTPEELMTQAARTFAAEVEKHGIDVMLKALELLPSHLREDVTQRLVSREEGYAHAASCR